MRKIFTLQDVDTALAEITAQTTTGMLVDMTLDQVLRLAQAAGSPHERLKVVHVAGTSGKTGTAHMTAYLLRQAGKKAGLTVSPGVVDIREWVQLDNDLMDAEEFTEYFREYSSLVADIDFTPTRFEYLMVFALWVFDKANVDYAVIETGLGGRVDASNICQGEDKLCIITDIGLDHVGILGDTLSKIASHKAGIIAKGNSVVMYEQGSDVMAVFREIAADKNANLIEIQPNKNEVFMRRNARLSYEAYGVIAKRDGLPTFDIHTTVDEVAQLSIPGRLQRIEYRGKKVLLDGAHNEQKMEALAGALRSLHSGVRWSAVFAMKDDKDYTATIAAIAPHLERAVVAPLHVAGGDMRIEGVSPDELSIEFSRLGIAVEIASSVTDGLDRLIDQSSGNILVTGSLYAVTEIIKPSNV